MLSPSLMELTLPQGSLISITPVIPKHCHSQPFLPGNLGTELSNLEAAGCVTVWGQSVVQKEDISEVSSILPEGGFWWVQDLTYGLGFGACHSILITSLGK